MKPGIAFSDHIETEKFSRKNFEEYNYKSPGTRAFLMPLLLILFFGMIIVRLFYLQILNGRYYQKLADQNRTQTIIIHAPRGIIFDRNNVPLVFNQPGFREKIGEKTKVLTREEAMKKITQGQENLLSIDSLRFYPYQEVTTHVLGYIGQISKEELENPMFKNYNLEDWVGKDGIEKRYEDKLRGADGKRLTEVDALGKRVRTLGQTEPMPGQNLTLTLDLKLQEVAFEAMKEVKKGAVVVSTPKGEILALISKPSFDPNLFTIGESYQATNSSYTNISSVLLDSDNQPLLNRAIGGAYPPGSTFKLITAAAGLENKIIDEKYTVEDTGVLTVGSFSFGNWYFLQYGKTEGIVNLVKAIKRSNDIFFYKLSEKIGLARLSSFARKFGLGEQTGLDLDGEVKGLVPTDEWKRKTIGEPWYLGDTYHYGIGQGYILATPIQVNLWTQAIANEGLIYRPHLLKNPAFAKASAGRQSSKFLSQKTTDLIREGMIESCSPGGVAWPLFEFKVQNAKLKVDGKNFMEVPQSTTSAEFRDYRKVSIACKTGTAQHGGLEIMPHAWITLFAPAYNPQIVVTVLVESSGEGSNVAAPIAKKILEAYFTK